MDRCHGGKQKFVLTNILDDVPDVLNLTPGQERISKIYDGHGQFLDLTSTKPAICKLQTFLGDSNTQKRLPIRDKLIIIVGNSGSGKTRHALEALRDYNVTIITREAVDVPRIVRLLEGTSFGSKISEMKSNALLVEGLEEMGHITNLVTTIPVVGTCADVPRELWQNKRRVYFKVSTGHVDRILRSRGLPTSLESALPTHIDATQASIKAAFGGHSTDVCQNPFVETKQLMEGHLRHLQSDIAPYLLQENYLKVASLEEANRFADSMALADTMDTYDALPLRFAAARFQKTALTGIGSLRKHAPDENVAKNYLELRPTSNKVYEMLGQESFLKHQGKVLSHHEHNKEQHNLHGNTAASSHAFHASLTEAQDLEATVSVSVGPSDLPGASIYKPAQPDTDSLSGSIGQEIRPVIIKQEGLLKLVRCGTKALDGHAEIILPQTQVTKEIRNKECCILVGAAKTLVTFLRGYTDYISTAAGEAIVFKTGAKRTEIPAGIKLFTFPRGTKILLLVEKMLQMKGITTVEVQRLSSHIEEGTACRLIQPYLSMSKFHFQGLLIDLESKTDKTEEEEFMVQNSTKMLQLRNAGVEFEMAKAFITYWREATIAPLAQMNLKNLVANRFDVKEKAWKQAPFLKAFAYCMEEATFVLCGKPQAGKTPLARAMASTYAAAKGIDYFIQSSTMDSLRQVFVQGFFRPGVVVILDEFRPAKMSQDPKADCCDMLKCLCDVANPGSVHCRYSDLKFAEEMPRIMTTNAAPNEWLQVCDSAPDADREAVLKRLIFIEVDEDVVPQAFAQVFRNKKRRDIGDVMLSTLESHGVKIQKTTVDDHGLIETVSLFQ